MSITYREFYTRVMNATANSDNAEWQELNEFAAEAIGKLDAKNEAAKTRVTKSDVEVAARRKSVQEALTDTLQTRDEIAVTTGCSAGQVTAAMRTLITEGVAVKSDIKVGKSTKVGYRLA